MTTTTETERDEAVQAALASPHRVFARWHGGGSYSWGDPEEDLEVFASISDAVFAFRDRYHLGHWGRQFFPFVNKAADSFFTPTVDESASMTLHYADGPDTVGEYPDRIIEFGSRGGVKVSRT